MPQLLKWFNICVCIPSIIRVNEKKINEEYRFTAKGSATNKPETKDLSATYEMHYHKFMQKT